MPALPAVAKVLRVVLQLQVSEDVKAINRFFIEYSGTAPTSTQLDTYCGAVSSAWGTDLASLASSTTTQLLGVTAEDLSSSTAAVGVHVGTVVGTRAGTPLEASVSAVLQFKVARRFRGGHPRMYMPAGVETDLAGQQNWTTAFQTAVEAGWVAFGTAIEGAGWTGAGTLTQVNVSYYAGFTVVTNPITGRARNVPTVRVTPVVDNVAFIGINPRPGTQRRRTLQRS